jgi:hypothetical protein
MPFKRVQNITCVKFEQNIFYSSGEDLSFLSPTLFDPIKIQGQ